MHMLWTVVPSAAGMCSLISGRLPLGVKGSLSVPRDSSVSCKKKSNHMIRRVLMVSESSFCPDTAWVCECVVWVGGGNLFTAHTRCFESSRQRKKDRTWRSESAPRWWWVLEYKNPAGEQPRARRWDMKVQQPSVHTQSYRVSVKYKWPTSLWVKRSGKWGFYIKTKLVFLW